MDRIEVLADWLEVEVDDLDPVDDNTFEGAGGEWMVLTEDEADIIAGDYIRESLWAFNADFISDYLPEGVGIEVIEALQPQCENCNDAILSMVGDNLDNLINDAVAADGRGHFMDSYDGDENEIYIDGEYHYIYRMN